MDENSAKACIFPMILRLFAIPILSACLLFQSFRETALISVLPQVLCARRPPPTPFCRLLDGYVRH
jgi:hypothetical protein